MAGFFKNLFSKMAKALSSKKKTPAPKPPAPRPVRPRKTIPYSGGGGGYRVPPSRMDDFNQFDDYDDFGEYDGEFGEDEVY